MPRRRPDPVEARVDALFAEPAEQFTAARDALVRELRADGDADAADRVRRLRRPTVAAWALNQVARRHGDAVRELTELGDDLRRAQRRALSGVGSDDLRRLGAQRRKLVEQVGRLADAVVSEAGRAVSPALHQAVVNTLEAAALSADDGAALLAGRLERDLAPESGFGTIDGFSVVPPPARPTRRRDPGRPVGRDAGARAGHHDDRKQRARDEALAAARTRVTAAEAEADRRRADEQRALEAHERAAAAEAAAATAVRELERELRDARNELDRDREAARAARRDLDQARRTAARGAHDLDVARAALERLDADGDT